MARMAGVFESRFQCGLWASGSASRGFRIQIPMRTLGPRERQPGFSNPDSNADSGPQERLSGFSNPDSNADSGPWPRWQGFSNPDSNADSGPQEAPVGVFESRFQCGLWAPGSACRGFRIQIPMRTLARGHGGRGFRIQIPMRTLGPRKRQD